MNNRNIVVKLIILYSNNIIIKFDGEGYTNYSVFQDEGSKVRAYFLVDAVCNNW